MEKVKLFCFMICWQLIIESIGEVHLIILLKDRYSHRMNTKRILHECSCFIKFIKRVEEKR